MTYRDDTREHGNGRTARAQSEERAVELYIEDFEGEARWCAWRQEQRGKQRGNEGKPTKIPYCHYRDRDNCRKAESNNPRTWISLREAEACWQRMQREDKNAVGGVGLFQGDLGDGYSLMGIDLDSCIYKNGALAPWAMHVIRKFDSYTEISPSGTGMKIFFLVAEDDVVAVKESLGGKTRRAFAAGEHKELAFDTARFYAVTEDVHKNYEIIQPVGLDTIRWLLQEAGPAYLRAHGVHGTGGNDGRQAGSGTGQELPPKLATLLHVKDSGAYPSRHELTFAFLCNAVRAGIADQIIVEALVDQRFAGNGIYEHIQANGGREAAERQLQRAREKVESITVGGDQETRPLIRRRMNQFERRDLEWLWAPFVPLGLLTLLQGDKAVGKSSVAIDMAARISTGRPWPRFGHDPEERAPKGSVIILCKENDVSRIIQPRLEAARADLNRVYTLGYKVPDDPVEIDPLGRLDTNIRELEGQIREIGDVKLIVIDPITDYAGRLDLYRDNQIRTLLNPLGRLASRYALAIVMVLHLNKKTDLPARYRGLGGVGIRNVAQSVIMVGLNKDAPGERFMAQDAANLCAETRAVSFQMTHVGLYHRIEWGSHWEEADLDERMAEKRESKQDRATQLLRQWLAHGPVEVEELKRRAKKEGISFRTMETAKKDYGAASVRKSRDDPWCWAKPGEGEEPRSQWRPNFGRGEARDEDA
jgi:AAA domain